MKAIHGKIWMRSSKVLGGEPKSPPVICWGLVPHWTSGKTVGPDQLVPKPPLVARAAPALFECESTLAKGIQPWNRSITPAGCELRGLGGFKAYPCWHTYLEHGPHYKSNRWLDRTCVPSIAVPWARVLQAVASTVLNQMRNWMAQLAGHSAGRPPFSFPWSLRPLAACLHWSCPCLWAYPYPRWPHGGRAFGNRFSHALSWTRTVGLHGEPFS